MMEIRTKQQSLIHIKVALSYIDKKATISPKTQIFIHQIFPILLNSLQTNIYTVIPH